MFHKSIAAIMSEHNIGANAAREYPLVFRQEANRKDELD